MSRTALLGIGTLGACAAAAGWLLWPLLLEGNLHEVVAGEVWRAAQPEPEALAELADELELRAVLSLRYPDDVWLPAERRVVEESGMRLATVGMSSQTLPSPEALARLLDALATLPRPLLLHCSWGVERSGLAAALALLMEGRSVEEARAQFGLRYGFPGLLSGSDLPTLLDDYEAWLAKRGEAHSPERLRRWARTDYVPYFYRADLRITALEPQPSAGEPVPLSFRVTNESPRPWEHRADPLSGVHVHVGVRSLEPPAPGERPWREEVRLGYVDAVVPPGGVRHFDTTLPPFPAPGRYRLEIRLVDEYVAWFHDMGSPPLVHDLRVVDSR